MKVTFWGVRGSIPTPGPLTNKYGGNTTCIEVRTASGELIILDAGTGLYQLTHTLMTQMPINAHILITHTHWDHIHGLPFCTPIYIKGNNITLYGGQDTITGEGIERTLRVQMQHSFFPIEEHQLKANVQCKTVKAEQQFTIGSAVITPILLNHPVVNFGYRIDCDGKSLFFTGDYEQPPNIYHPEDREYAVFQQEIDRYVEHLACNLQGIDVLIVDSSYTDSEYQHKIGWGHGTFSLAMQLAQQAQVKTLVFTHHEPTRTDVQLDAIYAQILAEHSESVIDLVMAREGLVIQL